MDPAPIGFLHLAGSGGTPALLYQQTPFPEKADLPELIKISLYPLIFSVLLIFRGICKKRINRKNSCQKCTIYEKRSQFNDV